MATALVKSEQSSRSSALKKFAAPLSQLADKSQLIKAALPNIAGVSSLISAFQRKPKNIIRVIVNDDARTLSPGDTLYGKIRLILAEPISAQTLDVILLGESRTHAERFSTSRNLILFHSCFTLVDKKVSIEMEQKILKPGVHEFPFEITLPRLVKIRKSDWPFDENTLRFNDNLHQPLPGSFEAYSAREGRAFNCSIKYEAIARLIPKDEDQTEMVHKLPVTLIASDDRALTAGETQDTSIQKCAFKFRLSRTAAEASKLKIESSNTDSDGPREPPKPVSRNSFQNKVKDNLLRFKLPVYAFDIMAKIPRSGRVSLPLDIVLKLTWLSPNSSKVGEESSYPVTLQTMRVELKATNMFRGSMGRTYSADEDAVFSMLKATDSYHSIWDSKPIIVSELKDAVDVGPETRLSDCMFVHPHSFPPAFKIWNIARQYTLTVFCDLVCADERFQAKYDVKNFNILAEGNVGDDFFERRPAPMEATVESEDEEEEEQKAVMNEPQRTIYAQPGNLGGLVSPGVF